jgi:hypothetical protein
MTAFVIPNAIQITTRQAKYTFASLLSRDTTFDVIYNIWRLARPDQSDYGPIDADSGSLGGTGSRLADSVITGAGSVVEDKAVQPKTTRCACGKKGEHYAETALETVLPGTPDKIHYLIFASGFIKDFLRVDQKLLGVCFPISATSCNHSYPDCRHSDIGLVAYLAGVEASCAEHVLYQASRRLSRPQANKMRAQGRDCPLRL